MVEFKNGSYLEYFVSKVKRAKFCKKVDKMTPEQKKQMLSDLYFICLGRNVVWDNPKTFTDKMQSFKLFGDMTEIAKLADKYSVRQYVADRIGEEFLIPLLGVWESAWDIDFDSLPNQFVLKTNNSSQDVKIIKDKTALSVKEIKALRRHFDFFMHAKFGYETCEFQYSMIKPMIIAEQYMEAENEELPDYKFFCFDGQPYYVWVDNGRFTDHRRNVYDMDWNPLPWFFSNHNRTDYEIPKPDIFDEMKRIAAELSRGQKQVRVDLYVIDSKVYFGEMTFTSESGVCPIKPDEANERLGDLWDLQL